MDPQHLPDTLVYEWLLCCTQDKDSDDEEESSSEEEEEEGDGKQTKNGKCVGS
jgi:hypothetical protein